MERAYADVFVDPAFFERQELLNDQRDIRLVLEFLDDFVGVERHAPNVEIFGGGLGERRKTKDERVVIARRETTKQSLIRALS